MYNYFFSWIWTACFRSIFGLLGLLLHLLYFIIRDSICTFLASEMELFMAVVNDVNSVTIAMDGYFLGVRNLLLIIIIFVDCYCQYLYQLALSTMLLPI